MFIADMDIPQSRKPSIFKIVSLTKHRPIFLYKPNDPQEPPSQSPDIVARGSNSLVAIRRAKEELQKVANKLNIIVNTPRPLLEKRSESCDLSAGKVKGITEEHSDVGDRSRIQRSIKEYLRLAYQRAEKDRRISGPKLPAIAHSHSHPEQQKPSQVSDEKKETNNDIRKVSSMKKALRRRGV